MTNELTIVLHARIKEGSHDAMRQMLPSFEKGVEANEPRTLAHQAAIGGDDLWFVETYANSDGFLAHFGRDEVQAAVGVLVQNAAIESVVCCGEPTRAARQALDGLGAQYATRVAGFSRREAPIVS